MANFGITTTDIIAADTPRRDAMMAIVAGANHLRNSGEVGTGFYYVSGDRAISHDQALEALIGQFDQAGVEPMSATYWVVDMDAGTTSMWEVGVIHEDDGSGYTYDITRLYSPEYAEAEAAPAEEPSMLERVAAAWPSDLTSNPGNSVTDYLLVGCDEQPGEHWDPRNLLAAVRHHLGVADPSPLLEDFSPHPQFCQPWRTHRVPLTDLDFVDGELRAALTVLDLNVDGGLPPAFLAFRIDNPTKVYRLKQSPVVAVTYQAC